MMKLGPTGEFPEGKLNPDDEGAINVAIGVDSKGNVIIDFGKEVAWIGFPPDQAIAFAKQIMIKAGAKKIEVTL